MQIQVVVTTHSGFFTSSKEFLGQIHRQAAEFFSVASELDFFDDF